jgi:hypothetical protein
MINQLLKDFLDEGVVVYTDEILIYAQMEKTDDLLAKEVPTNFPDKDLIILLQKCI